MIPLWEGTRAPEQRASMLNPADTTACRALPAALLGDARGERDESVESGDWRRAAILVRERVDSGKTYRARGIPKTVPDIRSPHRNSPHRRGR